MPIRRTLASLVVASMVVSAGCWYPGYSPGGSMASRDMYTYESTPNFAQNVAVMDWTNGERLLYVEVPVGQQLVVRFYDDYNKKNTARPALMRWKLMPAGTRFGELDNSMPVPGPNQRRLDITLRENTEAVPKATVPAAEPVSR